MFKIPFETESLKFVESLNVDTKLQLSCHDLVNKLRQNINTAELSIVERLKKTREFPSATLLSKLAWKVYEDGVNQELPEGWRELTSASNKDIANGYYGAAFWHPEHHHLVVSHRGTELNNVGAVVADIAGIVFNNCGGQMESACTFADNVVQAMKLVEEENKEVHFQLFFTGHSLGGWLAQVTSFSNYFLKTFDNSFARLTQEDAEPYHALTTVFDSPGCLPMLQKLKSRFVDGNPISLNNLSITSYLSAPNQINTCNEHFGKIYRIFVDSSKMNYLNRNLGYTLAMHSIENIANFFEKQREDQAKEVLDWPTREGLTNTNELEKFLKLADHRNRYHIDERILEAARKIQIRYKTRNFDKFSCPVNVFTKREQHFLENVRWIRQLPEFEALRKYVNDAKLSEEIVENLTNFEMDNGKVYVKDPEKLKVFVPHVKLLLKLHPDIFHRAKAFLMDQMTRSKVFAYETKVCLSQLTNDLLDFNPMNFDLDKLLEKQFVHVTIKTGRAQFGLSMVYKMFQNSVSKKKYRDGSVLVLDLKRFSIVNELVNIKTFLDSTSDEDFLLILVADGLGNAKNYETFHLENLFEAMKDHRRFKVVIVGESENKCFEDIGTDAKKKLGDQFVETSTDFSWDDLNKESREKILGRCINFQGFNVNLKNFFNLDAGLAVDQDTLLELLSKKNLKVNSDPLKTCDFSVYTADNDKREIEPKIILESLEHGDDIFIVSGLYDSDPEIVESNLIEIFKVEEQKLKDSIKKNLVVGNCALDETAGKLHVVSLAGNEACLKVFDEKCRDLLAKSSQRMLHWVKIKGDKLTWRKTFNCNAYAKQKLMKNSRIIDDEQILNEKTAAVVSSTGQGKTSLLTQLCKEKQQRSWIVHLRLNEVSFEGLKQLNHESLGKFIITTTYDDSDNHLQNFLLNHLLTGNGDNPVHFLIDGFDEVLNDKARSKALKLIYFIQTQTNSKLILTTSDEKVFSELLPSVYTFNKFARDERENLLKQFWKTRLSLLWGSKKCAEIFADDIKCKFKSFAKIILDQLDSSIDKNAETLMGVPQQLRLIAYGFQVDFDKFVLLNGMKQKIIKSLKIQSFYQHYINTKYDLYVTAKTQATSIDKKGKSFLSSFQNVTFDSLVPQQAKDLLNKSELFSPDYIVLQLTKGQSPPKVLAVLIGYLLTDSRCENVRAYLNTHPEYLPKTAAFEINDDTVKAIVGQPMITASLEERCKILDFLIEILRKKSYLSGVVLGKNKSNKTALEIAIEKGNESFTKSMIKFLVDFGDNGHLFELLQRNEANLMILLEKSEDREFVDFMVELIANNKL